MKIKMLGTGNAMVTKCYNTCFVIDDDGKYLLVDGGGGNGVLSQLEKLGLSHLDIHEIFVTHKHLDHLLGVIWLVRMICQFMTQGEYEGEANIYAHSEVIELIRQMSIQLIRAKDTRFIGERVHLIAVEDGEVRRINDRKFTFFDINSTKAKQFGFTMEYDGKKLCCCGDEPYNTTEKIYAENSDWLLHEAFCLDSQADIFHPYEKNHCTVKDACKIGESLGVKNLLLYHTEDRNLQNRRELYFSEGRQFYFGNLFVPNDLETIEL